MNEQQITAIKLALEAFDGLYMPNELERVNKAIIALNEALAHKEPEQEPEAWAATYTCGVCNISMQMEQPAQQQEPVAWRWSESNGQRWFDWTTDWSHHDKAKSMGVPIEYAYTTPQPAQRTWVGLTDADTEHLWEISRAAMPRYHTFKTLVEKALRERNT